MVVEVDLLTVEGAITAPAGYGKTHCVASAARRHVGSKPILVLTHTNAGVEAIRSKLDRAGADPAATRVLTLDGWAIGLLKRYPARSGHDPTILRLSDRKKDYPRIKEHAATLLESEHIDDILKASYARVIVDEYQDCGVVQHRMVRHLDSLLPVNVLGDPLQAIFQFSGRLVNWQDDVIASFGDAAELTVPHRWKQAGAQPLGEWLHHARIELANLRPVDLAGAPKDFVTWARLRGPGDDAGRVAAALVEAPVAGGKVLVVGGNYPGDHSDLAKAMNAGHVVENVDLSDLVAFADSFDFGADDALKRLLQEVAVPTMSDVAVAPILTAASEGQADGVHDTVARRAIEFEERRTGPAAAALLAAIATSKGGRIHRPTILDAAVRSLRVTGEQLPLAEAARRVREYGRAKGRELPSRGVGSTLLLKGLEAEAAVVVRPENLTREQLYVAMTRGSMHLTVCSTSNEVWWEGGRAPSRAVPRPAVAAGNPGAR